MVELMPLWVGISMLYLFTGVFVRVVYANLFPKTLSFSFISFGSALFVVINSRYVLISGVDTLELLGAILFVVAWFFIITSLHRLAMERRRWVDAS